MVAGRTQHRVRAEPRGQHARLGDRDVGALGEQGQVVLDRLGDSLVHGQSRFW